MRPPSRARLIDYLRSGRRAILVGDQAIREQLLVQHLRCRGFRAFSACHNNRPIGFAYGIYDGQGTGRRLDRVVSIGSHDLIEVRIKLGVLSQEWLDSFDIADLQVLQDYRRQGIGERLIRALCSISLRSALCLASPMKLYMPGAYTSDSGLRSVQTDDSFGDPVWVTVMRQFHHLGSQTRLVATVSYYLAKSLED